MKFGRLLKTTSVDLPEMEALFSAYKTLKVRVATQKTCLLPFLPHTRHSTATFSSLARLLQY